LVTAVTALAALTAASAACSGERLRPGPPSVALELPDGNTVTSPDTIGVRVRANDPNGLDTVSVALRDGIITLQAFASTELVELVFVQIPTDLPIGTSLTLVATAADLSGLTAQATATLTVVENGPSP
jgi:hypothetical protein